MLVETSGTNEVPTCPEWTFGKLLGLLLDPGGCFLLQYLDDVGDRVFRRNGDVEVDVFVTDMPGEDLQLLPLRDVLEHTPQFQFNECVSKYLSSVLGAPDYVVVTDPRCVGLMVQTCCHGEVQRRLVGNIDQP